MISSVVSAWLRVTAQTAASEADTIQWRALARHMREVDVPEAFAAAGVTRFVAPQGVVTLKPDFHCSIAAHAAAPAYEWLLGPEANLGHLVKRRIAGTFALHPPELVEKFTAQLQMAFLGSEITTEYTIHPSTLRAELLKRLVAGQFVPLDRFFATYAPNAAYLTKAK